MKNMIIDYNMKFIYIKIDLNESSCIISSCNHILILKSMNNYIKIAKYYIIFDDITCENLIIKLKLRLILFLILKLKNCFMCYSFLYNINKYNCLIQ